MKKKLSLVFIYFLPRVLCPGCSALEKHTPQTSAFPCTCKLINGHFPERDPEIANSVKRLIIKYYTALYVGGWPLNKSPLGLWARKMGQLSFKGEINSASKSQKYCDIHPVQLFLFTLPKCVCPDLLFLSSGPWSRAHLSWGSQWIVWWQPK